MKPENTANPTRTGNSGAVRVRKIAIIPTLLTLGNAVCGFASIAYAGKIGNPDTDNYFFALCGWLIIAAMVFDALDGYVARLARSTSKFGAELDSLCDAISFGAAPAFLLLRLGWEQPIYHQTLAVIATLYMVCTILRLARFNVETVPESGGAKRFRGLPSPAAAGCIASLAVLRGGLMNRWPALDPATVASVIQNCSTFGAFLVAILMVSRVPYPHMTKHILRGRRHFDHLIALILAVFVIAIIQEFALVLIFWGYVFVILGQALWLRARHHDPVPTTTPHLEP